MLRIDEAIRLAHGLGIIGSKLDGERALRASGVPYCVLRPCGISEAVGGGARVVLSTGDVVVVELNPFDEQTVRFTFEGDVNMTTCATPLFLHAPGDGSDARPAAHARTADARAIATAPRPCHAPGPSPY